MEMMFELIAFTPTHGLARPNSRDLIGHERSLVMFASRPLG